MEFVYFIYLVIANNYKEIINELLKEKIIELTVNVLKKLSNQYLIKQYLLCLRFLLEQSDRNKNGENKIAIEFELNGGVKYLENYLTKDGINDEVYELAFVINEEFYGHKSSN